MGLLWSSGGFLSVSYASSVAGLSCPALSLLSSPVSCFYMIGRLHGSSRIPIGLLWDSHLVDDDDNVVVAVDVVAAADSDAADDDDDNGHDGDDHQRHPQVIHIT